MNQIQHLIIGLGSNLGDKGLNLKNARNEMELEFGPVVLASSMVETKPWGMLEQDDFLNQVLVFDTQLEVEHILSTLKKIESKLGRVNTMKWGPRLIDLDILFYGNEIIDTETLKVPHPEIIHRDFVLVPLNEILPDFVHPVCHKSIKKLILELNAKK